MSNTEKSSEYHVTTKKLFNSSVCYDQDWIITSWPVTWGRVTLTALPLARCVQQEVPSP